MGQTYDLTGPEALSMSEVAATIGDAIGRRVDSADIPAEAWIEAVVPAGLPEWLARDLAFFATEIFAKGRGSRLTPAVRELTGRDGITLAQFARDYARAFQPRVKTA
jgi:uncharacterized protein YbjT (DUF2867 family)